MKPDERVEIPNLTIDGLNGTVEQTYLCTRDNGCTKRSDSLVERAPAPLSMGRNSGQRP